MALNINLGYEEMKALDRQIQEDFSDEEFNANPAATWKYNAKVID